MAITFVQQKVSISSPFGTLVITFDAAITVGNSVIICLSEMEAPPDAAPQLSDGTNTANMTQAVTVTNSTNVTRIYYLHNAGFAFTSVRVNSSSRTVGNISEWSGLTNAGAESTNTNTGTASSTVTTNSASPTSVNNLLIAAAAWTANDYSTGPTNSFTRMTQTGSGITFQEAAYLIQSSATSNSTGWGLTTGIDWRAAIAAFGAPGAAASNSNFFFLL